MTFGFSIQSITSDSEQGHTNLEILYSLDIPVDLKKITKTETPIVLSLKE